MPDIIKHVQIEVDTWFDELVTLIAQRTSMQIIMLPTFPSKTAERIICTILELHPDSDEVHLAVENELSATAYENRLGDPEILEMED